jgi:hypothetical protein
MNNDLSNNLDVFVPVQGSEATPPMATGRAVVLIADGQIDLKGEGIAPDAITLACESVPIQLNFDRSTCLGTAKLFQENGQVLADYQLNQEGLDYVTRHQKGGFSVVPAVSGRIIEAHPIEGGRLITKCHVLGLSIGNDNTDHRIPPLKIDEKENNE